MKETDLFMMSLVIFIPTLFALAVMFLPKGKEEYMRWLALLGTAVAFVFSMVLFIDYLAMLQANPSTEPGVAASRPSVNTMLVNRSDAARSREFQTNEPRESQDLLARWPWIPSFNIDYFLGVDGISMPLILLTTLLFVLSMIASWGIEKHVKGYCVLFLLLETGVLGTFLALDFFLFYIFWEVMLLPMYFLIGVWGGPRREYAAIKFFLYTLFGSVLILIALLAFYFTNVRDFVDQRLMEKAAKEQKVSMKAAEYHTFDLTVLTKVGRAALDVLSGKQEEVVARVAQQTGQPEAEVRGRIENQWFFKPWFQIAMFLLLFIGFAIKVPVFPFHTWLPDAHVEAPTPISMILAGILLKLGGYGIIRICYPICPWAAYELSYYIALFGVINIVYGAFAAMAQKDFKKLVAYSSISHMGYVILGIAVWNVDRGTSSWSWGMNGAMYQMLAHGISSAGMFFLVGVIYDRAHHRNLDNFRGLFEPMPLYGGISALIFFAALGLPGLCGFVGEFMVVLSTWNYDKVFAILAALTVVVTAAYILWTMQRVYLGVNPAYKDYPDITFRELLCIIPLAVLAVVLGVLPYSVLSWMEPHVTGLIDYLVAVR